MGALELGVRELHEWRHHEEERSTRTKKTRGRQRRRILQEKKNKRKRKKKGMHRTDPRRFSIRGRDWKD
jgi:hypothetical protein